MKISFYLQIVIIIICIFFIIRSRRENKPAQLDIVLYFFYYALFHNIYTSIAYYIYYPTEKFFFVEIGVPFGTAYGLFLYYAALKANDKADINIKVHIIPVIFWFLMYIIFFISGIYQDIQTRKKYNGCLYLYMVLSWLFYIVKLYIFLYKSSATIKLKSILSTISYVLGFTACVLISYLFSVKKYNNDFKRTLIYLAFLFCIIAVIKFYYHKKNKLMFSEKEPQDNKDPVEKTDIAYNEEEHLQYKELARIMEAEKIYLIPKLTVAEMSRITNINPSDLTELIAKKKHTFATFVNSYRINYAIELLSTTDLAIEDIAYKSGFNSRSTFYKQFIKNTNRHPSDYRL